MLEVIEFTIHLQWVDLLMLETRKEYQLVKAVLAADKTLMI
tara:strand:+ start:1186 stop:1308 length:123 start_codon:yes stop_codon:yes gene_type:complete